MPCSGGRSTATVTVRSLLQNHENPPSGFVAKQFGLRASRHQLRQKTSKRHRSHVTTRASKVTAVHHNCSGTSFCRSRAPLDSVTRKLRVRQPVCSRRRQLEHRVFDVLNQLPSRRHMAVVGSVHWVCSTRLQSCPDRVLYYEQHVIYIYVYQYGEQRLSQAVVSQSHRRTSRPTTMHGSALYA